MRDYRAYIFDIDGHRFIRVKDFLSDYRDDAAALSAAKQLTDKHDVEVWDCGRLVARLSPGEEVMSSPGLVPSLVFASHTEKSSVEPPVEPNSLSKVSELALDASSESNPFVF
jgi:hypothetical protein